MKPTIFMPKKIKAGFRKTSNTFTGKLAYVIYYDDKGKLRKEKSWNNWRLESLGEEDFDNKPTKGFAINKKVGGHKSGWNYRKSYIRIYDPRGFEFEITVENLVYILEHVTSSPENGLEDEFVYGWDGANLVLIPVSSPDYKEIKEYNKIIHDKGSNLRVRDLTVGGTYKTKDNRDYMYVGRKDIWEINYEWRNPKSENYNQRTVHKGKYHSFVKRFKDRRDEDFFDVIIVKSPSGRFIQEVSSDKSEDYDIIMKYINDYYIFNGIDEKATKLVKLSKGELKKFLDSRKAVFVNDKWHMTSEIYNSKEKGIYKIYSKSVNKNLPRYDYSRVREVLLDKGTVSELHERNEIYDKKFFLKNGKEFVY